MKVIYEFVKKSSDNNNSVKWYEGKTSWHGKVVLMPDIGFTPKLGEGLAWQRQGLLTNIFARLKSFNWKFYQLIVVNLDLRYIIFDSNYKNTIKKVYLCMMYL